MAGIIRFLRWLKYGMRSVGLASLQPLTPMANGDTKVSTVKGAFEIPKAPEGVELMEDIAPARWIEECLWPWGSATGIEGVRVGSFVPDGFAAYARVFHPAELRDRGHEPVQRSPVRWSTVASWTGRTVHPEMQFERIANLSEPYQRPPWGSYPRYGCLPSEECRAIANVLRGFTSTPNRCYFCVWEGWGFRDPGLYKNASRLRVPGRDYLLFQGPLDAVMSFLDHFPRGWSQLPSIWWPDDRAWCVATEIDNPDTYVGGSDACIERILSCRDLEALPTTTEARADLGGDTINI